MDEQENMRHVLIKVIGVGGGGCNAVRQMMDFDFEGVELISANTDMQVLQKSPIQTKLQLGVQTTRGLGAGSKPEVGRRAAEEDRERIQEVLAGADMVFVAAGMGGGTGTGAAPVIGEIARDMGILTVAIVTKPFHFEGAKRMQKAEAGLEQLKKSVDCLIVIPNDRISAVMDDDAPLLDSFKTVDDVLKNGVLSLANVIQRDGLINMDLEDVKTIMSERGIAMMGTGEAEGEDRARAATEKAISSPLLENIDLSRARGLLVNVSANASMKKSEYIAVGELINSLIDEDLVNVKLGLMIDEELGDTFRVTVVATGIGSDPVDEGSDGNAISEPADDDDYINLNIPAILRTKV
nr:cell division protein FtsZ [Suttonella sp. R2A3]